MPIVRIEMLSGRKLETKAALAREITRVMQDVGDARLESTSVIFTKVPAGGWIIGRRIPSDTEGARP